MKLKSYKKEYDYTYTLGIFETIEVLQHKPEIVQQVYLHSSVYKNKGYQQIKELCHTHAIACEEMADTVIARVAKKGNCYAVAVLNKYTMVLEDTSHVMLVNPSDMGNIGTIIRTMLGFEYVNLAIIKPAVDIFDPRVIRSSMGALFKINIAYFNSFEEYQELYSNRDIYTLMLKGATNIHHLEPKKSQKHTFIFGNESSGLPEQYLTYGKSIFIPHSNAIDSLNLSIAVGITLSHFSKSIYNEMEILNTIGE